VNASLLVMLPPVAVVVVLERWLVRGLVDSGK
jgi:sn-glycerol 3-phosphate transport system permease protein